MKIKVKKIRGVNNLYLEVFYDKDCYLVTKSVDGLSYELCSHILELEKTIRKLRREINAR